jgi:hypothetical protein
LASVVIGVAVLAACGRDRVIAQLPSFAVHSPAAARSTAASVFADVRLPNGAQPLTHLTENERARLGYYGVTQSSAVAKVGIWQVPLGIDETARFIEDNAPRRLFGEQPSIDLVPGGEGIFRGTLNYSSLGPTELGRVIRPFTRVTYYLAMSPTTPRRTDVLVGVQVYWAPPRPSNEEVPAGAKYLRVTRIGYELQKKPVVVSQEWAATRSRTVISHFAAVIAALPVQLHGSPPSCLSPDITGSTVLYRYVLAFAASPTARADFIVNYGYCADVTVSRNGRTELPLYDVPHKGRLVSSEDLGNAIEQLLSPGVALVWFAR